MPRKPKSGPGHPGLSDTETAPPHYYGHRERLRQRLIDAGAESLPDYELLEVLLFANDPRRDVKPLAKALIDKFGGFPEVLSAAPDALRDAGLREPASLAEIGARGGAAAVAGRIARASVINSWDRLIGYCNAHIAYSPVEEFHLLFLDRKNALIAHERQQRGTVNHAPVYTREVVKRALELQCLGADPGAQPPFRRPDPVAGRHRRDARHRQGGRAARRDRTRSPDHRPRPPHEPARPGSDRLTAGLSAGAILYDNSRKID